MYLQTYKYVGARKPLINLQLAESVFIHLANRVGLNGEQLTLICLR